MATLLPLVLMSLLLASLPEPAAAAGNPNALAKKATRAVLQFNRKAKKALLRTSKKPEFAAYFRETDETKRAELKTKIEKSTLHVQSYFDVAEICLINERGIEISRVVNREVAHDLSHDESGNEFFRLGFELDAGDTGLTKIYMSPDTHDWVVAYVTPIEVDGRKRAILHYEHKLESFEKLLIKAVKSRSHKLLVVNKDEYTIINTAKKIDYHFRTDIHDWDSYFEKFSIDGMDLTQTLARIDAGGLVQGWSAAYKRVGHWTIIALEP